MADSLNNFFSEIGGSQNSKNLDTKNLPGKSGNFKTDGKSPQGLVGNNNKKYPPGFTPNELYLTDDTIGWEGDLSDAHPNSPNYDGNIDKLRSTSDKFDKDSSIYGLFNDSSQDFFRHGLQKLNNLNSDLKSEKDSLHTWDGDNVDPQNPSRLSNFISTPYENTDPVMFGFEIVIDGARSPLFNGGVEDFITQFGFLKEVGSRSSVISNFKQQFFKFFKSNTPITSTEQDAPNERFYMSYYLKKVAGLEKLVEANTSDANKSFTEYKKDTIRLTFNEDVSLSIGKMAYLYKLLYWSKINGKNIIPQNLLRFNCDIIISEVRNFNRVRSALNNGGVGVEVLKDNLSRYVYSLYECQMFFDKMPHESEINLADSPKAFQDAYEISFNYKFASVRFENWVPDGQGFGQYAILNNDRMDPFETKSSETNVAGTTGSSIESQPNQISPTPINQYILVEKSASTPPNTNEEDVPLDDFSSDELSTLDKLKLSSKKASRNLAKNLEKAAINALQSQINTRARLLNNTLDKIRNSVGLGRMRAPTNVYKPGGQNSTFFYDVHNSLRDFLGESLGGALGG